MQKLESQESCTSRQIARFSAINHGVYIERTKEEKDLIVLVINLIMRAYQSDEAVKNANAIRKWYV